MDATRFKDDATEASAGGSFSVRCQGVESAWDIAGVTPETTALELKASLAASSGIASDSQRLIFQGACALHRLHVADSGWDAGASDALCGAGRILADDATLGSAGVRPGACTVHVAVRPAGVPAPQPAAAASAPDVEAGGLREEDLQALRVALEAELRAMAAQPAPFGRRAREGDISDFALGAAVGLLLGFVAMMCLLEPTASRRMRAGLFLGACQAVGCVAVAQSCSY